MTNQIHNNAAFANNGADDWDKHTVTFEGSHAKAPEKQPLIEKEKGEKAELDEKDPKDQRYMFEINKCCGCISPKFINWLTTILYWITVMLCIGFNVHFGCGKLELSGQGMVKFLTKFTTPAFFFYIACIGLSCEKFLFSKVIALRFFIAPLYVLLALEVMAFNMQNTEDHFEYMKPPNKAPLKAFTDLNDTEQRNLDTYWARYQSMSAFWKMFTAGGLNVFLVCLDLALAILAVGCTASQVFMGCALRYWTQAEYDHYLHDMEIERIRMEKQAEIDKEAAQKKAMVDNEADHSHGVAQKIHEKKDAIAEKANAAKH